MVCSYASDDGDGENKDEDVGVVWPGKRDKR